MVDYCSNCERPMPLMGYTVMLSVQTKGVKPRALRSLTLHICDPCAEKVQLNETSGFFSTYDKFFSKLGAKFKSLREAVLPFIREGQPCLDRSGASFEYTRGERA